MRGKWGQKWKEDTCRVAEGEVYMRCKKYTQRNIGITKSGVWHGNSHSDMMTEKGKDMEYRI